MEKKYVYVLRTCKADLTSYNGFQWPARGRVTCPDWLPVADCGGGLHGLLWGEGNGDLLDWSEGAKWLVVRVSAENYVNIDNEKIKFPCGVVVHCGTRESATKFLAGKIGAQNRAIVGATATAGYGGTATAGDRGTISVKWWDEDAKRWRVVIGYVGEDGLAAGKKYRLNNDHKFVEVE